MLEVERVLSSVGISLSRKKNLGFFLDPGHIDDEKQKKLNELLVENDAKYFSEKERRNIILQELLLNDEPITINELATKTKTGRSTVISDLEDVERYLTKSRIELIKKPRYGLSISAKERRIRNAIIDYLRDNYSEFDLYNLKNTGSDRIIPENYVEDRLLDEYVDIDIYRKSVQLVSLLEKEFGVIFSEEGKLNIILYTAVATYRISLGKCIIDEEVQKLPYTNVEVLCEWLTRQTGVFNIFKNANSNEFNSLVYCILAQSKYYQGKLIAGAYSDSGKLVHEFISRVGKILNADLLGDSSLIENMLLHFEATINRILFDVEIGNPLKEEIIQKYPQIYNASKIASEVFVENFDKECNDDEITYLALYIAVSIERKKQSIHKNGKMNALLVCASGIGTSNMLKARVEYELPNVEVIGSISLTELGEIDLNCTDFVITTTSSLPKIDKKVFYVSPLLKESEVEEIRNHMIKNRVSPGNSKREMINDLMHIVAQEAQIDDYDRLLKKLNSYFLQENDNSKKIVSLSQFAYDDYMLFDCNEKNIDTIIEIGSYLLEKNRCVLSGYSAELKRSKRLLGPNVVIDDGIALLHTKAFDLVNRLSVSFILMKEPVEFGNLECDPVKLVITLAAKRDTAHLGFLEELLELITEKKTIRELMKAENADRFRKILTEFEKKYMNREGA